MRMGASVTVRTDRYQGATSCSKAPLKRVSLCYSVPYALTQMLQRGNLEDTNLAFLRWLLLPVNDTPLWLGSQ